MMKKILIAIFCLTLVAGCAPPMPPLPTAVPIGTIVAQTMAALPKTDTPAPTPTDTPVIETAIMENPQDANASTSQSQISVPLYPCIPAGEAVSARVSRVLDGSTIEVAIDNLAYQVRYIGISPPAASLVSLSLLATGRNRALVEGQVVTLFKDQADIDTEGRWLRYVIVGNTFVNFQLLKDGFARAVSEEPNVSCQNVLQDAENQARGMMIGMWVPTPEPTLTPRPTQLPTPIIYYATSAASSTTCDCEGSDLSCKDFDTHQEAQACFNKCNRQGYGDVFNLDKDGDGSVCNGLP